MRIGQVLLCTFTFAVGLSASAGAPAGTREQAQRLYDQRKYSQACPLFERLANAAKTDGALWADLGLCEFKRGRKEAGERASLLAIRHGDETVRKSAYFNLYGGGVRADVPEARAGTVCAELPTKDCKLEPPLWACGIEWRLTGTGGGTLGSNLLFGFGTEAMEAVRKSAPEDHAEEGLVLSFMDERSCAYCQQHAWDCTSSSVVGEAVDACYEKATGQTRDDRVCLRQSAADGKLCDAFEKCQTDECARAEAAQVKRDTWPEAAAEYDAALEKCNDCGVQQSKQCAVVFVDPCKGRVGYVCEQERKGKKQPRVADEYVIPR